ncbi:hypothetical protein J2Z22_003369 [Paenibacillus forsythiae]|uniref:Uncharacterized protein n=1 Tax=Paenibacillus forsythiae TaxID=365616 RepID=A0ABU3HAE1_9BACL|nr:hypothetical protein [Paenibacillus forsythiae]
MFCTIIGRVDVRPNDIKFAGVEVCGLVDSEKVLE